MSFASPHLLWLLALPALWLVWELSRRLSIAREAHPKILRGEAGTRSLEISKLGSQISNPTALTRRPARWRLALGLGFAITALARPQWGHLEEPVFEQAREIIIALDLSRSMLAPDVKPSRLERARLLVTSLLEKLQGERVGLVVFSGTAFLQSPLSADYEILREFLPALGPDYLPEGGTNYPALIDTAITAFGTSGAADRFLIVLSDGEADDDTWKSRVDDLKAKGIRVIGLGIGTGEGAMIPDGAGAFVKDERGAVVMTKLDSSTLRALADATGGAYADASSWVDLAQLLQTTVERGQRGEFREASRVRLAERFQWALAPALLLLAWSFWREFPVRPRPRALRLAAEGGGGRQETGTLSSATNAALLLFFLSLVCGLLFPAQARAVERTDLAPAAQLAQTVGKLSSAAAPAARDWAGLANETLAWGGDLKSTQKPVPEGPVRDALAAATAGEQLDPKAADWPSLRADLEKLLEKPDEQKPPQPDKKDQPQQNQSKDQKDQNQSKDENQSKDGSQSKDPSHSQQPNDPSASDKQNQPSSPSTPKDSAGQNQPGSSSPDEKSSQPDKSQPRPGQQALGDMKSPEPTAPKPGASDPGDTQQVGGTPNQTVAAAPADPALVAPLQKLDQLRNTDSPVRLYQLMQQAENPPAAAPAAKKHDW
jgi:Ca-activated chloride channel family protein